MSETLKNMFATEKNISNSNSSINSESIQMGVLSPKPSCSKDLTNFIVLKSNLDDGMKPHNLKYEEEIEENTIEPLPKLPNRCENILNNYSDYEIYDENNNCMLTNLNDFGLSYFNINDDGETVDEYLNKDINLDSTPNDIELIFQRLTENFYNESSKDAKLEEISSVINENINILNLDEVKKQAIDQVSRVNIHQNVFQQNVSVEKSEKFTENLNIQKYCDESPEWFKLVPDDIEQVLKCNLISKVCVVDTVNEIPNDKDNNFNDNKFPETVCEVLNDNVELINDDNINLVDAESKDCFLVNDREIGLVTINSGNQSDESDACSYHSSDFEFIDEEEARRECKLNIGPIDIENVTKNNAKDFDNNYIISDYFFVPKSINNTSIPSGDDYHKLFFRRNVPYPCINIEHKAISSIKGMEVSPGPIADLKCLLDGDAKYKKEADESIQIILSMYPNENSRVHPKFSK